MAKCRNKGTCQGCELYGYCHCGCGEKTTVERWNQVAEGSWAGEPRCFIRYHHKRHPEVRYRGRKYSRSGVPAALVRADLDILVRVHGSQRPAARKIGCSQAWLCGVLVGRIQRVSFGDAQRIAEAVRGGRGLEKEWAKQEQRRAIEAARFQRDPELYKNRHKAKWAGDIKCGLCDWRGGTDHALYLHSVRVHDDRTQGQHVWVTKRREQVGT